MKLLPHGAVKERRGERDFARLPGGAAWLYVFDAITGVGSFHLWDEPAAGNQN
jgi:hypothetical protein